MTRHVSIRTERFGVLEAGSTGRMWRLLCGALRNDVRLRRAHGAHAADRRKGSLYYS